MRFLLKITSLLLFIVITFSCKKENDLLSANTLPEEDLLNITFSDTSQINAHTKKYDSIISLNNDPIKFLGSNQDPYFGRTDVGLYLNSNMSNSNLNFGTNATLISSEIILNVATTDYVGDALSLLNYSVFKVDSDLSASRGYYTNNIKLHTASNPLANYSKSFSVLNGKVVLRIPVNNEYAKSILADTLSLRSNDIFQAKYKGFYITSQSTNLNPISNQGLIAKFDLENDLSGFYLYYKNSNSTDTNTFKFVFKGANAARFNTVKYQPNQGGNILLNKQLDGDSLLGKESLFLKGLGATKLKVNIPFLKNYADSFSIAVNRAEVIFNVDPSFIENNSNYVLPKKLALLPLNALGKEFFPFDFLNNIDLNRYNGNYDSEKKVYVFNIARHVQAILNGEIKNHGFVLVVANPDPITAYSYSENGLINKILRKDNLIERVVLAGSNKTLIKPKFNFSYIKYKRD